MLITKLRLNYFGRFHDKEIELKPGINLIYGDNEAGKSTIHSFIRGMLFGIERMRGRSSSTKADTYNRYLPWDYPGAYSGSMDIRLADKDYRLQRSFHANDKSFDIIDLATGRKIKLTEGAISELVPGLTESTYKNTVSIEQLKAQTDTELAAELRKYFTNLSVAKSKEIDVNKALNILNDKRKKLEAANHKGELMLLSEEIEAGLAVEEKMDRLSLQLKSLQQQEQELNNRIEAIRLAVDKDEEERIEQLPAISEKYKLYQEITGQLNQVKQKRKQIQQLITSQEPGQITENSIEEDGRAVYRLKAWEQELLLRLNENNRQDEQAKGVIRKSILITVLPFFAVALMVMLLTDKTPGRYIIAALLSAAGIISYALLRRYNIKKHNKLMQEIEEFNRQLKRCQEDLDAVLIKYQLSTAEDFERKQKEILKSIYEQGKLKEQLNDISRNERELEDRRDLLYEEIMRYMQHFIWEDELSDASVNRLKEAIKQKKQATLGAMAKLTEQYNSCRLDIEKLKGEMSPFEGNEQELINKQERYQRLLKEQGEAEKELMAVKLAIDSIQELSKNIHDSFGGQLNKAVSEVICDVTAGRYKELKIDEKLDIFVCRKDDFLPVDKLSAGTIDQIYFSLRLAIADLLLGKEELPLILDDSFALYDEGRIKAAISRISKRKQIILFTCNRREEKIIRDLSLPCNIIDL